MQQRARPFAPFARHSAVSHTHKRSLERLSRPPARPHCRLAQPADDPNDDERKLRALARRCARQTDSGECALESCDCEKRVAFKKCARTLSVCNKRVFINMGLGWETASIAVDAACRPVCRHSLPVPNCFITFHSLASFYFVLARLPTTHLYRVCVRASAASAPRASPRNRRGNRLRNSQLAYVRVSAAAGTAGEPSECESFVCLLFSHSDQINSFT